MLNLEVQKAVEKANNININLFDTNVKAFVNLTNMQKQNFDNFVADSLKNSQSLAKVKDQKSLQEYFNSLGSEVNHQFTTQVGEYNKFFKDYLQQLTALFAQK